jgi:hypothetical protein
VIAMTGRCAPVPNLHPLFFVENDYGKLGSGFYPMDRDQMSRAEIVRLIRNGELKPIKVLEVFEPCEDFPHGRCTDVTGEMVAEAAEDREPDSLETSLERMRGMLIDRDRDLKRDGLYGWTS